MVKCEYCSVAECLNDFAIHTAFFLWFDDNHCFLTYIKMLIFFQSRTELLQAAYDITNATILFACQPQPKIFPGNTGNMGE